MRAKESDPHEGHVILPKRLASSCRDDRRLGFVGCFVVTVADRLRI